MSAYNVPGKVFAGGNMAENRTEREGEGIANKEISDWLY